VPSVQYKSNRDLRSDKDRHRRAIFAPQDAYEAPVTQAQRYGW
jgi:hypothetical protein